MNCCLVLSNSLRQGFWLGSFHLAAHCLFLPFIQITFYQHTTLTLVCTIVPTHAQLQSAQLTMAQQIIQRKQQELQLRYTNYKNGLQQIAQKIGDVEQEAEEHKFVPTLLFTAF